MSSKKKQPKQHKPVTWGEEGPTEAQVEDAMRVLTADYYRSIRSLAKVVESNIRQGVEESDAIHQAADGSYLVIYTHANFRAMAASRKNPWEEAHDSLGLMSLESSAQAAYCCVCADIQEELESLKQEGNGK